LAAILAADVVGYTRLMGVDEAGTLERLKSLRKELVQPKITERKGRIVKLMGDGLLAEFPSVVEAVQCAVDIQKAMANREADLPHEQRVKLRIGVNLGDIIVEGSDIYGDGVNVAARLEALADPGNICVSSTVFDHVKSKVGLEFADLGKQKVKNIDQPVQVYRIALDSGADASKAARTSSESAAEPELPDKPSIAVLPLTNMSGDPEQDYFSDGITEDIITELSRFSSLEVVARNSTFVYRDQAVDVSEIGEKLGAEYLLEGSVRKSGNRIRLTTQLIDVKTGKHVWADRYDRKLADIFAVQDELVHAIVATLAIRLTAADIERSSRKPAQNLAAYDLYLRALSLDRLYDRESARDARDLAAQAVALDPSFARAHAILAGQIFTCAWFEGTPDEQYTDEALRAAAKAVELDPDDSFCTTPLGVVHLMKRQYEQARHYFEMALKSNPHDTWVWADYAWYLMSVGKSEEALERLDSKEIFEPHPPNWHWEIRGQVLYMLKRYEEAKAVLERLPVKPFWVNGCLAACCGQLDQADAARRYWEEARQASPGLSITFADEMARFQKKEDADHWVEGLRKAGLAE
jgi:TolB-like protein